jgi:PAS domain S-box-containing protein
MPEPAPFDDQRMLAEVLESLADPIVAFDKQYRYTYVSRRASEVLGKTPEEMIGRAVPDLFPADAEAGFQEVCERAWREARPISIELKSIVMGVWVEVYVSPSDRGAVVQWRDITTRKQAEKALSESEAALRTFFDSPGVMRGIVTLAGGAIVHISCNQAAAALYNIDRDQIEGKTPAHTGTPDAVARAWVGLYEESRRTGKPVSMEYSRPDAQGTRRWMLATAAFLGADESGAPRFGYTIIDLTDRKRAEEALQRSEARLRALSDNLPEAALYQYREDAAGRPHVDFVSAGIERIIGVPASEYLTDAATIERNLLSDDYRLMQEAIAESREKMTRFQVEVRHRHRQTGEITWSLMRSTPCRMPDGSTVWDGIELDITEHKKVEQELRETQERLRERIEELEAVMNVAPVAIFVSHDPECRIILGNRMGNRFYEAHAGENLSSSTVTGARQFYSGGVELRPEQMPMQRAAAGNCDVRDVELEVLLQSGTKFSMLGHASPLRDVSGRVRGAVGAFLNITERKRAEEELQRAHETVRLAHRAAGAGTWRLDFTSGDLFWSEECFELFGVDPSVKPSRDLFISMVHPEDRDRLIASVEQAVNRGREIRDDYRLRKGDGYRWIERHGRVLCDRAGTPLAVIGISRDVTDRKRMEIALRRSNEDLQRFAYVASHDLQEPLRNVGALTTLLLRKNEGRLVPQSRQLADLIARGVQTMNGLIESLLEFSRVTNDNERHRPVNLNEVLTKALRQVDGAVRAAGAWIESEPLPTVPGNPDLLVRVFQNLLGNAIKYRAPGRPPVIRISAMERKSEWLISVKDNGIGFDMKYADQIFVPFKRLHAQAVQYSGTGIGLAIVKRIIDRHGGLVSVESEPGVGSTFRFVLPASGSAIEL